MARLTRIVVPDLPHHVTQRGNRRQALFVEPGDFALYRDLMAERCRANGVDCWAYCLMPNHVHLILTPTTPEGLARAVGEAHRRYTAYFNARARVTGHLFQGRFASRAMDETHLIAAARYLALNPVKARLIEAPPQWPHASVRAHLAGRDDCLVTVAPLISRVGRFADLWEAATGEDRSAAFDAPGTGRPLGSADFVAGLEARLGRALGPGKRGPKPKGEVGRE